MNETVWHGQSSSDAAKGNRNNSGFSRADLLACLAVVSVMATLLVTWAKTAAEKSKLARCAANLQQVSRAVLLYAPEHGGRLPDGEPTAQGDFWWWYKEKVKGYAGLTGPSSPDDRLFACPADRGYSDPKPFCRTARFDYSSYVLNGVRMFGVPNVAGWRHEAISQPQQTLLVMEWTAHAPLSWHKSRTGRANAPFYNDAQSEIGYVDGHVSFTRIYYDGYNPAYTRDPIPGYDYKYSGK